MGIKNLIALAVHPLMALATSLVFVLIATLQPTSEAIDTLLIATGTLILAGMAQSFWRPEMLSLRASPTNFGQTVSLLGLTVGLTAFADGGGMVWIGPEIILYLAVAIGIITLIEGMTRLVFMTNIWKIGSQAYAEKRISRILRGNICNWNARIDAAIRMASGRSIVHDRHARDLAEAARSALGAGATAEPSGATAEPC